MRKVIQISISEDESNSYLNALCSDGTMWRKCNNDNWEQIEDVPQPEPKEKNPINKMRAE